MNWGQLQAILWLRWRLTRNQFVKSGKLSMILVGIAVAMMAFSALGAGVGGIVGGYAAGKHAKPEVLLLVCDVAIAVFLFVWMIGVAAELQRSESINISKLLHLPITLTQVFLFNFAASHLTPSIILMLPLVVGFSLGMVIGGGARFLLMGVVAVSVLLMISALTYCLRGWLSALMANRRRARNIAMWITVVLVLIAQLPNLLLRTSSHGRRQSKGPAFTARLIDAHIYVPPGWVGYSAYTLKKGQYLPSIFLAISAGVIAVAGLKRSYTLTLRHYRGDTREKPARRRDRAAPVARRTLMVERTLPWVTQDTAGLALATLRSLLRAPEFKMALVAPIVVSIVGFGSLFRTVRRMPDPFWLPFMVTAAVVLLPYTFSAIMGNMFGLDRGGFRALVLSPMERHRILLARNLAMLPPVAICVTLLLVAGVFLFRIGPFQVLTGLLQGLSAFVLFSLLANYMAILAPFRYSANSMQAKKMKPVVFLAALVSTAVTPFVGLVLCIPPLFQLLWSRLDWANWIPLNVVTAAGICALAILLYRVVLVEQGKLLQKRELKILETVTAESE